jgi:tetratricopeptide (TPR) repeat protein
VIRGDIETITLKALEKPRDRRYESAAAFGRDIKRFLEQEPIEARRASMGYQLKMFSRRHRVTVSAAAMVVVAITAGLVLFWISWARAEWLNEQLEIANSNVTRERNAAQEQLAETKQVHRDLSGTTLKRIRRLNGAIEEKERIARSVVDYFQNLDEAERQEEDLMVLGQARIELAEILGGYGQDNLGRYEEAIEELETAILLWEELVEANPEEFSRVQHLALARDRLADVYKAQDRYPEAILVLESARIQLEQVLRNDERNIGTIRVLCSVYSDIGDVRLELEDPVMAHEAFGRIDELLKDGLQVEPEHAGLMQQRGHNLRRLGFLHEETNPAESVRVQKESLAVFQSLAELQPESADAQQNLALAWFFLGQAEVRVPLRDEAIDHLGRGWDLIILHCSVNPGDSKARRHVELYLSGMAEFLKHLEAIHLIPERCRSAVLVLQPVVEANPDNLALAETLKHLILTMREHQAQAAP